MYLSDTGHVSIGFPVGVNIDTSQKTRLYFITRIKYFREQKARNVFLQRSHGNFKAYQPKYFSLTCNAKTITFPLQQLQQVE
jgi:hypothetical protein